ncbi:MAG TPA: flavin reductase family protein [Propionibacteriaceae bacterium]|nr:flavin reductase family protein [Propionibacteriaceae bacterium]
MTIHSEHPFLPPENERSALRRLRGRLPAPVTVWTTQDGSRRAGWTVSSLIVADGEPAQLLGLIDEDSDLAGMVQRTRTVAVSLLGWQHRGLGDAFAGTAPAPGGPFRLGAWTTTPWGPVLTDGPGWLGARLSPGDPDHAGWSLLIRAIIEQVEVAPEVDQQPMAHLRGRYRRVEAG